MLPDSIVFIALAFVPLCTVGLLVLGYRDLRSARRFRRQVGLGSATEPFPAFVRNPPERPMCQVIDLDAHRRH